MEVLHFSFIRCLSVSNESITIDMIPLLDTILCTTPMTPTIVSPRKPFTQNNKQKPTPLMIDTAMSYPTPPPSHQSRKPSYEIPGIGVTDATPPAQLSDFMSPQRFTITPSALFPFCTGDCRGDELKNIAFDTLRTGVKVVCDHVYTPEIWHNVGIDMHLRRQG